LQTLTLKGVKAAARRFYRAGKLTAQHRNKEKRLCVYDDGFGYRCVIGAALSRATLKRVHDTYLNFAASPATLRNEGIIVVRDDELKELNMLQNCHDAWAKADTAAVRKNARKIFLTAIGIRA
jgi:hypothetical protein